MKNTNNICLVKKNGIYKPVDITTIPPLIEVGANECFECILIQTGESIHLKVVLADKGASCDLKCVYLAGGHEQKSLSFDVTHASEKTQSKQIVKGIATDRAVCSFSGIIHILPNAQKCSGKQNHRALLLSDGAEIKATPELEIFADDVICSHGSAVGPLDKNQLFYLLSRGIDEKTAYHILLSAFLEDILPAEYHYIVREWLNERL